MDAPNCPFTDAINFIEQNREKLIISNKEQHNKESREPEYNEDKELEKETVEKTTTTSSNQVF
jgi:hypothetical protein